MDLNASTSKKITIGKQIVKLVSDEFTKFNNGIKSISLSAEIQYKGAHNDHTHDHMCVYDIVTDDTIIRAYVYPSVVPIAGELRQADNIETKAGYVILVGLPVDYFKGSNLEKKEGDYTLYGCLDLTVYIEELGVELGEEYIPKQVANLDEDGNFIRLENMNKPNI